MGDWVIWMFRFGFLALVSPHQTVFISSRFFSCRSLHHCSKNQNPDHLSIRGNKSFVLELEWNLVNGNTWDDNAMIYSIWRSGKAKGAQKLKDKYPRRVLLYSLSEKEMLRSELSFNVKYWYHSDFWFSVVRNHCKSYQEIRLCSFEPWNLGFIGLRWKGHQVVSRVRVSRHR